MAKDTGSAARAEAARIIASVYHHGRSLDDVLASGREHVGGQDQGLLAALSYGVLRDYRLLKALIKPLLKREPQPLLETLLLVGIYQIRSMRVPPHAAVHATVAATAKLGLAKAKGMVNAILRRYQREAAKLEGRVSQSLAVQYSHPDWLAKQIAQDWPDAQTEILAANNTAAPMCLRVNRRQGSRRAYRLQLEQMGIDATESSVASDALALTQPVATAELPGFASGRVSVQDIAAQQAADLLELADGQRVLDACAAPGNKTAHILERVDAEVTALEVSAKRLQTLQETLQRLRLTAQVIQGDAGTPAAWWDGQPYDRILLDAPCSGTGVIRRHPDIKWLRRASDIGRMAQVQRQLLAALWPLLANDGQLVYATCSILEAEGSGVVKDFLNTQPDAAIADIRPAWGESAFVGTRLQPGSYGGDGFYYAVLRKG